MNIFISSGAAKNIFLGSGAAKTNRLHNPANAVPAVAGCSNCLLNTLLDTVGVQSNLSNAVHHSGRNLCNASPALAVLTDSVIWIAGRLSHGHFAEDAFNAILVNLAVFGLCGNCNEKEKTQDLHGALRIEISTPH